MKTIAIANQKGGVGKTTTTANLGIGLARQGKSVLLIDCDAQGSLTESLGYSPPESLSVTLSSLMGKVMADEPFNKLDGILQHPEGVSLLPSNIELSGLEYINEVKSSYDYVLIDCTPSLGMLTINALAAADSVIIPVQAQYLPLKGLEQLIKTIGKVKRQINPNLQIEGILMTMVDTRTNFAKDIVALLRENYGGKVRVFGSEIPLSIRAAEISAEGKSIFAHDKNGKVAVAYENLTKEVLNGEKSRQKHKNDLIL